MYDCHRYKKGVIIRILNIPLHIGEKSIISNKEMLQIFCKDIFLYELYNYKNIFRNKPIFIYCIIYRLLTI